MEKEEITLNMTPDEINIVLEGLGNLPFVKVYALIGKIQDQASVQLRGASMQAAKDTASVIGSGG